MKSNTVESKAKNLFYTLFANMISLMSGILATFLIPKLLSVEQYAYFKEFTFYLGYVGVFHFGFNDGVYIQYGKYDYEELPKKNFRGYFRYLLLSQILVAIVVALITVFRIDSMDEKIIFLVLAFNIILANIMSYFDYVSQFTRRFKIYSFNMILSKVLFLLGILAFIFINDDRGLYFVALQTLINILIFCIYCGKYREIIFGSSIGFKELKREVKVLLSTGFFVMIGNFMSIFIIGIDRIFIDNFFTKTDFAMYSFATSLLLMFYILVNAVTTFIYPYLTRELNDNAKEAYRSMKRIIFMIIGISLCAYYPFKFIVIAFIPKYIDALSITAIIFPTILLSAEISIVSANFYKTLKLQKEYTKNNLVAGSIAVVMATLAFVIFKDVDAIAVSSLISFFLWGLYSDLFFGKKISVKMGSHYLFELSTIAIFLILSFKVKWYLAFIIYIVYFLLLIMFFFREEVNKLISLVKDKKRS